MGNAVASNASDLTAMITPQTIHVTDLEGRFDRTGYLSPHSDLVALLVIEHQANMLNLITRVGWEARIGEKESGRTLDQAAAELVDYLLFVDEAVLPGPITGTSRFAEVFRRRAARQPRPIAARPEPRDEAAPLSVQLSDLLGAVRWLAREREGRRL